LEITRLIYSKFLCPDAPSGANVGLHDAVGESLSPIYTTRLGCLHLNHGLLIHIIDANSAPKACLAGEEPQQDLAETKPVLRATARRGHTLVVTKPDRLARSGPPLKQRIATAGKQGTEPTPQMAARHHCPNRLPGRHTGADEP
jgi:hypothetical protein